MLQITTSVPVEFLHLTFSFPVWLSLFLSVFLIIYNENAFQLLSFISLEIKKKKE